MDIEEGRLAQLVALSKSLGLWDDYAHWTKQLAEYRKNKQETQ